MKIYIAGPISGLDPEIVKNNFKTAALELRDLGHSVVNPVDMSGWDLSWEAYMCIAETILKTGEIDGVLMLEGWEHSKGARIEHAWAVVENIPIYYEEDGILGPSQKLKKERAERPYDALGDDRGRGGTADDWYQENFVERYDDQPKFYHKLEFGDDAIIEAIKRGNEIPREVKK